MAITEQLLKRLNENKLDRGTSPICALEAMK